LTRILYHLHFYIKRNHMGKVHIMIL